MLWALALTQAAVVSVSILLKPDGSDDALHGELAVPSNRSAAFTPTGLARPVGDRAALVHLSEGHAAKSLKGRRRAAAEPHEDVSLDHVQNSTPEAPQHRPAKRWSSKKVAATEANASAALPALGLNKTKAKTAAALAGMSFWETLKSKAADSASRQKAKSADGKHAAKGAQAHGKSAPTHRPKRITIAVIVVAALVLGTTCVAGLRMRARARGPLASDAKALKEFAESRGPPPHLRVRHWQMEKADSFPLAQLRLLA
eukprot:CAMPEP_0179121118 /NCGR_PEP_ID=MMETSP0796-20121207/57101_1 /TAXON_ID=73915 /ORGANISM="Pyrodinium bahamense, Strain pbaha01" /LENGTH=257 /DNA_ID=CAMNT_0020819691 /DNA_START=183 /DNA_END=957 /DNA_ORIENTATION=-